MDLLKTPLGRLRLIAFVEGVSFLVVLFITMPLKYGLQLHEPNLYVGMLHGVLFVLYIFAVLQMAVAHRWTVKKIALSFLASIIPFGTFWADKKLFQEA